MPPTVSVVVCSRNRPALLGDAVDSILRGDTLPLEIVVIDQSDAAHDDLSERGQGLAEVRYVWDRARGVSRARNLGVSLARGDAVALIDDDELVDAGWLGAMVRALESLGERGVVTGRVLATAAETPGGWAPALVASEAPVTYQGRIGRDVLEAGNMAAYRATLLEVGGFDAHLGPGTTYPAGEDNDLGLRLLAAGCVIRYDPGAVIYHRAWRGLEAYVPLRWRYGIGQGAYYAKHLSLRDAYMLGRLGRLFRTHLGMAAGRARREPRAAAGHVAYLTGVLAGLARWSVGAGLRRRRSERRAG
jgi:GT2 family glycosyltransferase